MSIIFSCYLSSIHDTPRSVRAAICVFDVFSMIVFMYHERLVDLRVLNAVRYLILFKWHLFQEDC